MATSSETRPARSLLADLRTALGWGARVALLALMTWTGSAIGHPSGPVVDLAIGLGLGLALLGLGSLGLGLLRWVAVDWARVLGRAFLHATIGAAAMLLAFASVAPLVALTVWGAWLAAGTGLTLAVLVRRSVRVPADAANAGAVRGRALLGAALAASLTVAIAVWWWWPGSAEPVQRLAAGGAPHLTLPDPGAPGPLPVATLRYGSGLPGWRPEYGAAAALRTAPVDLADLVRLGPVARPARRAALGFGLDEVPLRDRAGVRPGARGPRGPALASARPGGFAAVTCGKGAGRARRCGVRGRRVGLPDRARSGPRRGLAPQTGCPERPARTLNDAAVVPNPRALVRVAEGRRSEHPGWVAVMIASYLLVLLPGLALTGREGMAPVPAAHVSGVFFVFGHVFLAFNVTSVGAGLLVFALWEGCLAGLVRS